MRIKYLYIGILKLAFTCYFIITYLLTLRYDWIPSRCFYFFIDEVVFSLILEDFMDCFLEVFDADVSFRFGHPSHEDALDDELMGL